ncbi:hypothetical protein KBTX_01666 [wastewater metagenome]|uniref:YdhG-like domain-containing protein n=2 Tax=unclassified sequences TaxID=12908 RepID=A0A5B8R9A2_9ZZZZ|nr:DUF1801 domain-containing protein [Arhodomonas sp. KWT]QEA05346.1 hypothetical protein KBTEX_01666 [uncultured organism]
MAARKSAKSKPIVPGGVEDYIEQCPEEARPRLREIRDAIHDAAPGAVETVSYFRMPGYCYEGYDYNGMFAWFSFRKRCVRLHVRPPVLTDHEQDVAGFSVTKAIISFPLDRAIPKELVVKLVGASIAVMTGKQQGA